MNSFGEGNEQWCFDQMVFIVAGRYNINSFFYKLLKKYSGCSVAYQTLNYLFLGTYKPLYVIQTHNPENPDELFIDAGIHNNYILVYFFF